MAKYISLLLAICFTSTLLAQIPKPDPSIKWKKRLKTANTLYEEGYFASAGEYYKSVLKDKPNKDDVAFKAGECYSKVRDYNNVVSVLRLIKDNNKDFDKVGLKYALALKQAGEYEQATKEFEFFLNNYKGSDFEQIQQRVQKEIEGCVKAGLIETDDITYEYISQTVNSPTEEFGPIPFNDDVLYFTSDFEGTLQIYRTLRRGSTWTRPKKPAIFKSMEDVNFGNGAFTPDRTRFYFTQCKDDICQIYLMKREGRAWSDPIILPKEINTSGDNNTQPFVTTIDGKEVLYFSSNREGGQGGMDIWYTIKEGDTDNFSIPVNLGEPINTSQDEVTPFYDNLTKLFYFSSNGHVNIGGFDIYKAKGSLAEFTNLEQLELPYNSNADDLYYTQLANSKIGFFVSNRLYEDRKNSTQDNDLYRFEINQEEIIVRGSISDERNPVAPIGDVIVVLHEITSDGRARKLDTKIFSNNNYQLLLLSNRKYRIEVEKVGYKTASADINTANEDGLIVRNITLAKVITDTPPIASIDPDPVDKKDKTNFPPPPGKIIKPIIPDEEPNTDVVNTDKPKIDPLTPPGGKPTTKTTTQPKPRIDPITSTTDPVKDVEPVKPNKPRIDPITSTTDPVKDVEPVKPNKPKIDEPFPVEDEDTRFKIVGQRSFKSLNTLEIDAIRYIEGKPYLKTPDGFYRITSNDDNSNITTNNDIDPINSDITNPGIASGTGYKIQLAAVSVYKPYKFKSVGSLGAIQIEEIDGGVKRVLVSSFSSLSEARRALAKLKARGYDRAFIAKYENGNRVGRPIKN